MTLSGQTPFLQTFPHKERRTIFFLPCGHPGQWCQGPVLKGLTRAPATGCTLGLRRGKQADGWE